MVGMVPSRCHPLGVICYDLMPWFIYKIYPPEIKETPQAAVMAQKELDILGPITKG